MHKLRLADGRIFTFENMEYMGIINVTPDSFFQNSRVEGVEAALQKADAMIEEGANFLDIGGESTRPGSMPVTWEEECQRIVPVIETIAKKHPDVILSVDTYHGDTAQAAIKAGAHIINDISGLTFDDNMASIAAKAGVPVIIMHTGGRPKDMQVDPQYDNVVKEVYEFLERQIQVALGAGVGRDQIIIDLGIGFGKNKEHNLELLRSIDTFKKLNMPHLMAVSRKTVIGHVTGEMDPMNRLAGTVALSCYGALHDIEMVRVHDVAENRQGVMMMEALR